jgi:hypothetical protein
MRARLNRRIEKCLERRHEELRFLSMREVAAPGEARQRDARHERRGVDPVSNRNQGVVLAPEDGDGRQIVNLSRPVEEVTMLSTQVDDVAHAPREGSRSSRRRIHAREHCNLFGGVRATRRVERHRGAAGHERLAKTLHDEWERSESQRQADLPTQAAGSDQSEASNSPAVL